MVLRFRGHGFTPFVVRALSEQMHRLVSEEIVGLFNLPFTDLLFRAAEVHRAHHAAGEVQLCTLLSIKTGGCAEDCGYCSQSASASTGLKAEKLMDVAV